MDLCASSAISQDTMQETAHRDNEHLVRDGFSHELCDQVDRALFMICNYRRAFSWIYQRMIVPQTIAFACKCATQSK